jgi:hypothetical protein
MPFRKVGPNKYVSPSGRTFNRSQISLYYAKGGRFPGNPGMKEQLPSSPLAPDATLRPRRLNKVY